MDHIAHCQVVRLRVRAQEWCADQVCAEVCRARRAAASAASGDAQGQAAAVAAAAAARLPQSALQSVVQQAVVAHEQLRQVIAGGHGERFSLRESLGAFATGPPPAAAG